MSFPVVFASPALFSAVAVRGAYVAQLPPVTMRKEFCRAKG